MPQHALHLPAFAAKAALCCSDPGKAGFLLAARLRQPGATGQAESPEPALSKSHPPARAQCWGMEAPFYLLLGAVDSWLLLEGSLNNTIPGLPAVWDPDPVVHPTMCPLALYDSRHPHLQIKRGAVCVSPWFFYSGSRVSCAISGHHLPAWGHSDAAVQSLRATQTNCNLERTGPKHS